MLKLKIFETAESFFERQYPPEGETIIGRNEDCDLVLKSRRASKRHGRIFFQDQHWHIEDLGSQNGTIVNGSKIKTETLKDGDVIQIGDYRIEVEWKPVTTAREPAPVPVPDDDRTVVVASAEHDDRTVVRPSAPAAVDSAGGLLEKINALISSADSGDGWLGKITALIQQHKLAAGLAGGVLILLLVIIIITPDSETEVTDGKEPSAASKKSEAVSDMETQDRINTYLQSGRDQFEAGNYSQALVRFQAVLEIDPQNQSALSYLDQTRQKITEAEEIRRQELAEEQKITDQVQGITARVRQAMAADNFLEAKEIIAEAVFLAPDNQDVLKLKSDIETAIQDKLLTREQEEAQKVEKMAAFKQHFDLGQQYYDQKNYREALKEWDALLAMNIEAPETEHTRQAIGYLRKLLEEDVKKDYEKALSLQKANDLTGALISLQRVVEVSPDYQDTKRIMTELLPQVESQARRLYQEGLVYEGLGQDQKAAEKWRSVLKVMPLPENDIYQKALEKMK